MRGIDEKKGRGERMSGREGCYEEEGRADEWEGGMRRTEWLRTKGGGWMSLREG